MTQLFSPIWWVAGFASGWQWALACLLAGLAALPLCLKVFRALPDRGSGLAISVALYGGSAVAWFLASPPIWTDNAAAHARMAMLAVAIAAAVGGWARLWLWRSRLRFDPGTGVRLRALSPAVAALILALVPIPHGAWSFWLAALLFAAASIVAWWGDWGGLRRALRGSMQPAAVAALLFLFGFVYFTNVRSYIPYASWDASLSGAEKIGNLMHLNSAMRAEWMPPADAWFAGEPENYYYGGHLMIAGIAKATGTKSNIAFNLGVATIFALTLNLGFSFAFNFAQPHRVVRRAGGMVLHSGIGWGLLGAVAIAFFGNLDAWVQLAERLPTGPQSGEVVEAPWRRFAPGNLASANWNEIDYWRSSRAIHGAPGAMAEPGTITEFPYFTAILGDLHAHHFGLGAFLIVASTALALLRSTTRGIATSAAWLRRSGGILVAMGLAIGVAFGVNSWDAIVAAPLFALAVAASMRGCHISPTWRWSSFILSFVALLWGMALLANSFHGTGVVFGPFLAVIGAAATFAIGYTLARREGASTRTAALLAGGVALVAVAYGGIHTARAIGGEGGVGAWLLAGARDAALFALCGGIAAWFAFRAPETRSTSLGAWAAAFAICGFIGLLAASPLMSTFQSPLRKPLPLFDRAFPPILEQSMFEQPDAFWRNFWDRSPIAGFPAYLRTTLVDYVTHWGIFAFPVLLGILARLMSVFSRWRPGQILAFLGVCAALVGFSLNMLRYWLGPIALVTMVSCLVLTYVRRADREVWVVLAATFFFLWFCEALHFDDQYAGDYERYNTPFKIWYPLWPLMAVAAVRFVREGALAAAMLFSRRTKTRTWLAAAFATPVVLLMLALGLLYPYAATSKRTRSFFGDDAAIPDWVAPGERELYTHRTLDSLAWMKAKANWRDDASAIEWLQENAADASGLLEAPPEFGGATDGSLGSSYSPAGRISAATGIPAPIGWAHHELQWRGWQGIIPDPTAARFRSILTLEQQNLLQLGRALFPGGMSLSDIQLLKSIASLPPQRRESAMRLYFPDVTESQAAFVAATLRRGDAGRVGALTLTESLVAQASRLYESPDFDDEIRELLALHRIQYVVVGTVERLRYGADSAGFAKFETWPIAFQQGRTTVYRVPDLVSAGSGS